MPGMPSALEPEVLARWLLASEGGAHTDPEEQTMAAIQIYQRLRVQLSVFLGLQGFDALWERTLHVVRRTFPRNDTSMPSAIASPAHRLDVVVQGRDAAEAHQVLLAIFTQFLTLLFTFIGADLGFRLLQQGWPELQLPTVSAKNERAQQ